jgi:hypothetical protein
LILEDDSANVSKSPLEHVANTDRRIKFRAVELQPKENRQEAQVNGASSQQHQTESGQYGAVASTSTAKDNHEMATGGVGPTRDAMELDE